MSLTKLPTTVKQWHVRGTDPEFKSLEFSEQPLPVLGDSEVLVKLEGASLNYRDLTIAQGTYPIPVADNVVPGSDGAGEVIAIGRQVTRFNPGDKVVTLFNQAHIGGRNSIRIRDTSGLGASLNGTLRNYGAFNEQGLVRLPSGLSAVEGATLSCAGLTAWNALYGLPGSQVQPGQWVLTQGTGGVSIFGIQFAKAAGARVIATTGSEEKIALLKDLGVDHIINYKTNPDWGAEAKRIAGGEGVDHVIEVAGATSMKQSLAAIAIGGVISIIGYVGGTAQEEPGFLDCLSHGCIARGFMVGSRVQMEDMCRAIEADPKLRPVIDKKVFSLEQVKEAYEYQWSGKHFGKVCISIV
ncbi:hypothetical protein V2A60_006649 [Cordyceps javanica]|uniref:Alcohol dehydrogenase superfamily, zinc-type n=1 Tax=Cordyceps javanica TaxID=43265 RepID=A0A545V7B6_9HYPO|nr:Alcohol dehydrogenase superfamily, zinc-type [Cordyceps javanica]TQW09210.1 Alcohol dehydrogenase superfamily, zinc-type [Cordyceps javanica]